MVMLRLAAKQYRKLPILADESNVGGKTYIMTYALTKLVEEFAIREFAAAFPTDRTGAVANMAAPGLYSNGLGRDARAFTKIMHEAVRAMMARTAEVGRRTILHGLVAGEDSHGKLLSGCKVKEYWVPEWVTGAEGQRLQKAFYKELMELRVA